MPATNPRLTITVRPALAAVLRRLSALTGNSQSALVGELLSESLPVFERMVEVLSAAEKLREEGMKAPEEVARSLDRAQARIEQQFGLVLDDMDAGVRPLLDAAEKVGRRRGRPGRPPRRGGGPGASAAAAETPLSNRGVRSDPPHKNQGHRKGGRGS